MKKLDIRLIRLIRQSKGQFFSIVAIVSAALALYIMFNMLSINIRNAADDYYIKTNMNDIHISVVKIPKGALGEIERVDGINEVQGRVSFDVPLMTEDSGDKAVIRLISTPSDGGRINTLYMKAGGSRSVNNDETIVLEQFAEARDIGLGDVIVPHINGADREMTVTGIASSSEFIYLMENEQALLPDPKRFGVAFVSEGFAQSMYGYASSYNEILVTLDENANEDDVVEELRDKLAPYGVKQVVKREDQLSNNVLTQKMDGIDKMSNVLPIMFLFVAAMITVIMISRIVMNDRIQIGVLKAIGYGNGEILSHYTKYSLSMGMTGAVIGVATGLAASAPMSRMFVSYFNIPISEIKVHVSFVAASFALTALFCSISGIIGARTVIGIMPAESMRPETPKGGKRILLERFKIVWNRLRFSWKMIIRNIMRTKRRFAVLMMGLSLAYAINTVPIYIGGTMSNMFEQQYGLYQKMDYVVGFANPVSANAINELGQLVDADLIEPRAEYPFEIKKNWREKTVSVIGVPIDTRMHYFEDTSGSRTELRSGEIIMTEALAKGLGVQSGDSVTIRNFLPGRADVEVTVCSVIRQDLGMNAFMDIETMQRRLLDTGLVSGASIVSKDDVKKKLEDAANVASVRSTQDMKDAFLEYLDTMIAATSAYMIFGGILGFAIIYNSTVIGIAERRMELAALRVMGLDKKDIFHIVTRENALLTIFSTALGIPLGMGMIAGMASAFSSDIMTLPVKYEPGIFITAAVAMAVFAVIAQFAARRKIYSLDFIEALKNRIS